MLKYTLIILSIFFLWPHSQKATEVIKYFKKEDYIRHLDSLKDEFGSNKSIPEEYELECLIALSYYPELKNVTIEFIPGELKTTMAARPRIDAIFNSKSERTYRIFINNSIEDSSGINYEDVPFNARIGLIGHELGHITDYEQKSMFRIILNGIGYISNSTYRKNFEKNVDQITIDHGLGYQLYAFSFFVFHGANIGSDYLDFKKENYPSLKNYKMWLKEHPEYSCSNIEQVIRNN